MGFGEKHKSGKRSLVNLPKIYYIYIIRLTKTPKFDILFLLIKRSKKGETS